MLLSHRVWPQGLHYDNLSVLHVLYRIAIQYKMALLISRFSDGAQFAGEILSTDKIMHIKLCAAEVISTVEIPFYHVLTSSYSAYSILPSSRFYAVTEVNGKNRSISSWKHLHGAFNEINL